MKKYCNPLVAGHPATKSLTMVYEIQPIYSGATKFPLNLLPVEYTTNSSPMQSVRLHYNKNLVMQPKLYMTFAAGYWFSNFNVTNSANNSFVKILGDSRWHFITASTNIIKPNNEKEFIFLNFSVEANGNSNAFKNYLERNVQIGGAAIYGRKKGFQKMLGVSFFRGYRLGNVIHVSAVLYNSSFNKKWGVDALLPAREIFRYRSYAKLQWFFGYELDGTQFAINNTNTFYNNQFFQHGKIRPKMKFITVQ